MTLFIGHKKPDTDTVCAAIAAAKLYGGEAGVAEALNPETEFVLNYFGVPVPAVQESIAGRQVFIVDHNQTTQAPEGYEQAEIVGIIDHHTIENAMYTSKTPIEVTFKPWGSTSTIIADLFFQQKRELDQPTAGILLASILSDTLCFQSPTTTKKDREIVEALKPLAKIQDEKEFAKQMFKAKSDIVNLSTEKILDLDYKLFEIGNKKIGIGVAETVEPERLMERKNSFLEAMKNKTQEESLDYIYFLVVDILNSHTVGFMIDEKHAALFETIFGGKTKNHELDLGNRVSRKKQIVPPLTEYLSKK